MRADPADGTTRRQILAALAALGTLGAGEARPDRAAFLALSARVTGMEPAALEPMADALLAAIRATPLDLAGLDEAALALAWYSGTLGTHVISYDQALVWRAMGYDAVPGTCGGDFGAWGDPPPVP